MTVDLLGLKEEEIMEGVEFAGVGALFSRCFGWECEFIHLNHLLLEGGDIR